ncbi:aconitase X catalytic domain-containing protein [Ornithinimicrobium cavernae]|uniref:aconitase X catalytic domain-containing protein n=1 Tax=Ornithinimicrobium cavernae TaxID=2666047 RepID=UPI000D69FC14|nr:aconitase X catalytic domain-containing protein [Ornithinimicrobium cavernae]
MKLTDAEHELLNSDNVAVRMAMRIVMAEAQALGATQLVEVTSAHVVDTLQFGLGQASFDFADHLRTHAARVSVPTTLNTGNIDACTPEINGESADYVAKHTALYKMYESLGARPTFTCSPFQEVSLPSFGEHVAWGESNAVSYVNSVLGARTLRHAHFSSIASAITGRAPLAGLHLDEGRVGQVLLRVSGFSAEALSDGLFYHLLGYFAGTVAGSSIVVVDGLPDTMHQDHIKAFGAAATTSGAVPMYHLVGITPEADSIEGAFQGSQPLRSIDVTHTEIRGVDEHLQQLRQDEPISCVAIGAPHLSVAEVEQTVEALDRSPQPRVPIFLSVSRHTDDVIQARGWDEKLAAAGVRLVHDKCSYFGAVLEDRRTAVMTDSAKWADYGPNCLGSVVAVGSIEDCVASAAQGRVVRATREWA